MDLHAILEARHSVRAYSLREVPETMAERAALPR